ncbi:SPOUT methyltransferase [Campylobacter blaseri]|uniref:Ribosomal RNA large subunit methyltransferase H n=1 Tax=Campylobacter blaseri TaxID=2042961 RepID=A0A2P8QZB2_9BACT|nr:23S rRNA (pseudouridine(1915)-N(3))-methyltransferase RlmH [Campylobacter blaseri]PSM51585.1 23S rRNA (pseudouridine(1915)-N(3))-methyltransferase RlmH [Campylobacter blaseri]PSM53378.1 23S rRNA (pseudouridine(1915)-N(3))-methyltransferase RlmH [Campylobacter blaseri]QKF86673.1 SPOUT methyltransferase [Campylobacter blaseri]
MEILVNSIQKNSDDFNEKIDKYIKMSKKYAKINDNVIFNDMIAKAQSKTQKDALIAYDKVYLPKLEGYNVALDEKGKILDSYEFAKLFSGKNKISFFIGGAFGLSDDFKKSTDAVISLTKLTLSHKIAKLILFEQIFRALCINANHPYHK